jgi:hypothetical protein
MREDFPTFDLPTRAISVMGFPFDESIFGKLFRSKAEAMYSACVKGTFFIQFDARKPGPLGLGGSALLF